MAITPVTVTFKLVDFLGYVPDTRRTKVLLDTNVDSGFLVDTTTGGSFRIADATVTIDSTGLASFSVLPSGATGLNPSAYQIRVRIDAANPVTRQREMVDLGWYTITAAADLKDLVAAQYVPPTYLSTVTATLDSKVTAAEIARDEAEAAEASAQALVLSDLGTTDGQTRALIENPASQTAVALSATIEAEAAAGVTDLANLIAQAVAKVTDYYVTPQQYGAVGDGVTDDTVAVQAAITAALTHTDPGVSGEKPLHATGKNGAVFFPLGTYSVNELNVPGTIAMWGVGGGTYGTSTLAQRTDGQSIIRLKGDTDGGLSQSSVIEHLSFKSGSATSADVAQIITDTAIGSNSVYIRNCWFKTPEKYGVWITQGNDIKIEGCTFDVSPYHGVRFGSGANAVTDAAVTGCTFYDIALNCIELDNIFGLVVAGNRAFGRTSSPPTTSRFVGVPSGGATLVRTVAIGANEARSLGGLATLSTITQGISITGGAYRDLYVAVVELTGGGVLYGLSMTGVSVMNDGIGFSAGAAISGPGCGLQASAIGYNAFFAGAATALLMSLSDARVIDNNLKGNARLGFTAEHNLAAPASNGF